MLKILKFLAVILALGLLLPARGSMSAQNIVPVLGATARDWNSRSFWYSPWGKSGVHKGIDIFAQKGTPVLSNGAGLVLFKGEIALGGNVVAVLGAKWRIHYYAHLERADVKWLDWVSTGGKIGQVGDSGNAAGKPPHLHYSIITLVPYPWRFSMQPQGWKRMFYLNPCEHI
jgi:murein DD-endopeptidase MepM/ murein hydrolase activator NlpD